MDDDFERLVSAYRARASSSKSRLGILTDLERIRDSRAVPFLLGLLRDQHELNEVRVYVVKRLRSPNEFILPENRPAIAQALGEALADSSNEQLRLQVALTLGDFTNVDSVLSRLAAVSLAQDESIDLRYAAFTSVERAGPTPECIAHMRQIANDEALGDAARSVLSAWHAT